MKILTPQEMLYRESEKYKRGCASQIPAIWHNIAINAIEFAQEQAKIIALNPDVIKSGCNYKTVIVNAVPYCERCKKYGKHKQTVL